MTPETAEAIARRLFDAQVSATPVEGLSDLAPDISTLNAYRIQAIRNALAEAAGATPVGHKIGFTSPASQAAFGATEPMRGVLYAQTRLPPPPQVDLSALCAPKLEGEIILKVGTAVRADADDTALLASLASVHAAIEIADSRIQDWRFRIGDAIADNACCGRFALAEPGVPPDAVDLAAVLMSTTDADGAETSSGSGAACLGSPLNAYRWLLADLEAAGQSLAPGSLILTGALGPVTLLNGPGCHQVKLTGLGAISVHHA